MTRNPPALEHKDFHSEAEAEPRLLVFDLDGTLIDSRKDLSEAVNATLAHHDRSALAETTIQNFIGDGAAMLVKRSLLATGQADDALTESALAFFLDFYREHLLDHTYVYPEVLGVLATIQKLKPGLPMAVLTNKPVAPSRRICNALGLAPFFFGIYGSDSFPTKKPDPAGLLEIVAATPGDPDLTISDVVLIGDSEVDVQTARTAGARSIGCLFGFAPGRLLASAPDRLVHTPSGWLEVLGLL